MTSPLFGISLAAGVDEEGSVIDSTDFAFNIPLPLAVRTSVKDLKKSGEHEPSALSPWDKLEVSWGASIIQIASTCVLI